MYFHKSNSTFRLYTTQVNYSDPCTSNKDISIAGHVIALLLNHGAMLEVGLHVQPQASAVVNSLIAHSERSLVSPRPVWTI
jgi:hypothetical protein